MFQVQIEEPDKSRQIASLGTDCMAKTSETKVCIIGLQGVCFHIITNIL